jgi:hypothetical protein
VLRSKILKTEELNKQAIFGKFSQNLQRWREIDSKVEVFCARKNLLTIKKVMNAVKSRVKKR